MLDSFFKTNDSDDMIICYEDNILFDEIDIDWERTRTVDLDHSVFLHNWLNKNKDIIPVEYGGLANPKLFTGNRQHGFRRRASQWFRKIATLYEATRLDSESDIIIFVDSDITFKKKITKKVLLDAFNGTSMFYHLGSLRSEMDRGMESGFIGFKGFEGRLFLDRVFDMYETGKFRDYIRWDDSYIFKKVLDLYPIPSRDLLEGVPIDPLVHPMEHGMFKPYFYHDKGSHSKKGCI